MQGSLVGLDEMPSKGPLLCTKRFTFTMKDSLFTTKDSLFSPVCKQKVHCKENKSPLPKKGPPAFYVKGPTYTCCYT